MLHHRTPLYEGTTNFLRGKAAFNGTLRSLPPHDPQWTWPLRWPGAKHPLLGEGAPSLIFVGVMTDLFHEGWPRSIVDQVVATIVVSRHIGQLLTKRPERMAEYFSAPQHEKVQERRQRKLWLGFSAERQFEFDARWPHMRALAESGWTVFVSVAPMLSPVTLPADFLQHGDRIWCIASGEEGRGARFMEPDWARVLRDQCAEAGVAFFMLQMTGWQPIPRDLFIREFPCRLLLKSATGG